MDIYFVHQDGLIFLKAPFNREANQDYKKIGGRWSPDRKMWSFESQDLNRVRKALVEHFGYDDRVVETVDARVVLNDTFYESEVYMFGRRILARTARDFNVLLGKGVILDKGYFARSGGSVKRPAVGVVEDVVLGIWDIPISHPDLEEEGVTIIERNEPSDMDKLRYEKSKLLSRLAEIDKKLS